MSVTRKFGLFFAIVAPLALGSLAVAYSQGSLSTAGSRNEARAGGLKEIMVALEGYHAKYGKYPIGSGKPASELQKDLVGGGFLTVIPEDPRPEVLRYLYASNGKFYGLLVRLEEAMTLTGTKPAVLCMVGVGNTGTGIFGEPPPCDF